MYLKNSLGLSYLFLLREEKKLTYFVEEVRAIPMGEVTYFVSKKNKQPLSPCLLRKQGTVGLLKKIYYKIYY